MNFPAPLAVLGFLAACGVVVLALASIVVAWFASKLKFARILLLLVGAAAVVYFGLLFAFSLGSHSNTVKRGQEKYFCEIDCHLAYSIVEVKTQPAAAMNHYVIYVRTRFDETTISPTRSKEVPLIPLPRIVRLVDESGDEYVPVTVQGTSLLTCLKPGDSYTTQLEFDVPRNATGLRLLIHTVPEWPDRVVIGDENSWLHKKTYLAL